jgi:hypothetical protein
MLDQTASFLNVQNAVHVLLSGVGLASTVTEYRSCTGNEPRNHRSITKTGAYWAEIIDPKIGPACEYGLEYGTWSLVGATWQGI